MFVPLWCAKPIFIRKDSAQNKFALNAKDLLMV